MTKKTSLLHRMLSALLAVVMLLSCSAVTAFAADGDAAESDAAETAPALADGEYIVSVQNWGGYATNDKTTTQTKISASPRALLTVKDGTYTVTLKLNSKYMGGRIFAEPDDIAKGQAKLYKAMGTDVQQWLEGLAAECGGSIWSKFQFSEEYNGRSQVVTLTADESQATWNYATFTLKDPGQKFFSLFWAPDMDGSDHYERFQMMALDLDSAFTVAELKSVMAQGGAGVALENASRKNSSNTSYDINTEFAALLATRAKADGMTVTIDVNATQLKNSPLIAINQFTSKRILTADEASKYYRTGNTASEFLATYGTKLLSEDKSTVQVTFTDNDLIYGIMVTAETEETAANREKREAKYADGIYSGYNGYFAFLCLTPNAFADVSIADSNETGVYVTGRSNVLPEDAKLTIEKDRALDKYDESKYSYTRDAIMELSGSMYRSPKHWFYINLTDAAGNALPSYDGITLHIPMEQAEGLDPKDSIVWAFQHNDGIFFNTENGGNDMYGGVKQLDDGSYEIQYVGMLGQINIQNATFFYAQKGDYQDIYKLAKTGDDDGIYTAKAQLQKFGTNGSSMANAAMNEDVMITIHNGEVKMYFTSGYLTIMQQQAYIGELMCYNTAKAGEWYEDSVSYTGFLTDETGALVSNCGYDPVSEAGCVLGGVITFRDESYDADKGCYDLAVVPPAMLGGVDYSTIDKSELTVHLRITDLQKTAGYSDENVNTLVKPAYHFDKSALRRAIDYAALFAADEYTKDSYAALQAAVTEAKAAYDKTYADVTASSDAYETQIASVKSAIAALEPSTELTRAQEELRETIAAAKAIEQGDKTASAYNDLQSAIGAAESVLGSAASGVDDLTAAKAALESAVETFKNSEKSSELDKNNLADGVYSVYVDMIKMDRNSKSMSDNAINHIVKLEVKNGEYFVTLDFRGITIENRFGYLKSLAYYADGYSYNQYGAVSGTLVPADVLTTQKDSDGNDVIDQYNDAENLYPDLVTIKLVPQAIADPDGYAPLHVFVPIMESISEGNGDQDVLMKVDWSTLKATTNDDPNFQPEEPEEQSPAVDFTDKATGVTVKADKGVLPAGVQIIVTEITSGSDYDAAAASLADTGKKFKLYDVRFVDESGSDIQPNGPVTVGYPIPAGYDAANVLVYRVNADGSKTRVSGAAADGFYTVITKSAGAYALVEKGSTITDAENTANQPKTGDAGVLLWGALLTASAGALILAGAKKRRAAR